MHLKGLSLRDTAATALLHMANISPDPKGKHMRAIATLYDAHSASMFGSQCISLPVEFSPRTSLTEGVLRFDFDVFWHTQIVDPEVTMLIQFTMASQNDDGALVNEYCIGWCQLIIAQV